MSQYISSPDYIYLISGCILGGLFPDLDIEKSWFSQSLPLLDDLLRLIAKDQKKKKNKAIYNILKHRGYLTHSILTIIISIIIYVNFTNLFTFGIILGVASHLILDKITDIGFVSTGTKSENYAFNIIWVINSFILYNLFMRGG